MDINIDSIDSIDTSNFPSFLDVEKEAITFFGNLHHFEAGMKTTLTVSSEPSDLDELTDILEEMQQKLVTARFFKRNLIKIGVTQGYMADRVDFIFKTYQYGVAIVQDAISSQKNKSK